ncbi:c-type cytochrome biogenesis protein CcsB, partial [Solicola sp. PLA-1-18]
MTLAEYATFSNYAIAAATVVLSLAWLAHMAEWGFARQVAAPAVRERALVNAGGGDSAPVPDEVTETPELRRDLAGRMGISFTVLATLILLAGVVTRGLAAERVPWGNMFEFSTAGVTVAMTVYLILVKTQQVQWLGGIVTGFGVIVLGLSMTVYVPAGPLVPALHSYWLVIHVAAAMIAGSA